MLKTLKEVDTSLFLWVNSHHNMVLDWVLWILSQWWCWAALLVLFFGLTTLRREPRKWWFMLAGIGLCFLVADQTSVHLLKETVCRLRPCHALEEVRMFRTHCGGQYGFVSSHAANAFALLTLFFMRYRKSDKWTLLAMALWAIGTCYSRVYLGKHYPGDIAGGALLGIIVGLIVYVVATTIEKKIKKNETK